MMGASRPALFFLLSTVAVALACSGKIKQAGGVEVHIALDNLNVGTDFDKLTVDVLQETQPNMWGMSTSAYDGPVAQVAFPTTVAIVAGSSSDQKVWVKATAYLSGAVVVQSSAQTTVPSDRVVELDLYLSRSCESVTCTMADTACAQGLCKPLYVDPSHLPDYMGPGPGATTGGNSSSGSSTHDDGSFTGSSSGVAIDSGTGGPTCNVANCPGCCDPKASACVLSGSTCSNGMTCTGPQGSCSGSATGCTPTMDSQVRATCQASGSCYTGPCSCLTCPSGSVCSGTTCVPSTNGCSPATCPGCCDGNACVSPGMVCSSGGTCNGSAGAPCSATGGPCSPATCNGCCAGGGGGGGSCIPLGGTCPNSQICKTAGSSCASQQGNCGLPGQPCCTPNACMTGTCTAGVCTSTTSCSVPTEPTAGVTSLTAVMQGYTMNAVDGFVVLSGGGAGPMSAMFYFTDYANACGYAQSGSAKSGGKYITFGVSPSSGSGYSSLMGSFVSGGGNLGPAITLETPSGGGCAPQYLVSSACGSGQLIINITSASATQVTGSLSGNCNPQTDKISTGPFSLPVCGTSLSVNGTSACCQ